MRLGMIEDMQMRGKYTTSIESGALGLGSGNLLEGTQKKRPSLETLCLLFVSLIMVASAQAQFIVTPMEIEIEEFRQGTQRSGVLTLENRDPVESHLVKLEAVELVQDKQGSWLAIGPNELADASEEVNLAKHASCREWINLSQSSVEVPAYDRTTIPYTIRPTGFERGFYCAGIRVSLTPRPGQGGVVVQYDFVVPVLITMAGPTLRSKVELADAGLSFVESNEDRPASTLVTLNVKNNGSTYAKLDPKATVWQVLDSGKTRMIKSDLAVRRRFIIPGEEITLSADLGTHIPSGKYKVLGSLSVDGRPAKSIEKVVDFVNPTGKGILHEDAAMRVDPPVLELAMRPGRIRSSVVSLFNGAQEDIVVKAIVEVPRELAHKTTYGGTVRGEHLSCAEWIDVRPNKIAVRGESPRNVRLVIQMPEADTLSRLNIEPSHYYATVRFYGYFRDGTSAGVTTTLVAIRNGNVAPEYVIKEGNLKIESLGDSKFSMVGSFTNMSLTHIKPTCVAHIASVSELGAKTRPIQSKRLENIVASELMMPFEERNFSSEFDFSNMPNGMYSVEARFTYKYVDEEGETQVASEVIGKRFQVYTRPQEDERRVQIIGNTVTPGTNIGG